ncbi:MAG: DEAD/DEAH box helicase [Bacteroidales bacterium]
MKKYFFALGYISHRLWGNILIPQLLEKNGDSLYYATGEILLKNEGSLSYQRLSPMQKEVVSIIDEYNDRKLHRLFSKKGTVKEFQDTIDAETIKNHIRPYIEKRLFAVFQIAAENNFKVFLKDKLRQNVFNDDFLTLHRRAARPFFQFQRTEENTLYRLTILRGGEQVELIHDRAEVISNRPASILLGKDIYFIEHLDAIRLTPFFFKRHITIQKTQEEKYYKSFIASILKEYDTVETTGFEVREIVPEKIATVTLEFGLKQEPVWLVSLKYNQYKIYPGSTQRRFIDLQRRENRFSFTRFSRDADWEEQLEVALEEIGLKSRDRNVYTLSKWLSNNTQDKTLEAIKFTNDHYNFLVENGFEVQQKLDREYYLRSMELVLESKEREDWFDLLIVVKFGKYSIPFVRFKNHILKNERLFELPDGTIAVIPEEWFARYRPVFEFGKSDNETLRIHKQHFSQVDAALRKKHASTMGHLEKLNRMDDLPEVGLPLGLQADLRSYQAEGFAWLWLLQENGFGGCLADDMGLGKTLQAIAILLLNKEKRVVTTNLDTPERGQLSLFQDKNEAHASLVVVPASLIQNWVNEIDRFSPSLKVITHSGISRARNTTGFSYTDVVVSSYHTVRQDIEFLREYPFHYVILDESQTIKNPHSKLYRAMTELQASHKMVVTGTPIENSLTDLWSQINFVNEGLLGSLNFFKKQFVKTIEKKKNKEQEQRLKELINPFILRRTKEEVAKELPPLYEQYRFCNMTDEQKRMYEEEKSTIRNSLLENLEEIGMERSAIMVLKGLTRLRQISNHPLMVEEDYEYGSGKYDEVFRNIESVIMEGHKVLVFSSFVKHLNLYADQLDKFGWKYALLTGSTVKRQDEVDKFQNDPECRIFLISMKAGGIGLNLTAADYVFMLDPWWNPAVEMQALNRAHRIGQDKNVFVYRFISNHTVEEKMLRLQNRKSELANTFVTSNNPLRDMHKEEIMDLFS